VSKAVGGRAGLHIHRSERADLLVAGLARLLAAPPADPFTPDVVAVPSRGVERWIAQSLSASLGAQPGRADGVCAAVAFPSPARLVQDAVAGAVGLDPEADPWDPERLAWHVLAVIDEDASEAWCAPLARHLGLAGDGGDRGRRMAVAQKFAGLFASYASQRPAMVLDWLAGRDTDGHAILGPDHAWQAELWRRVRAAIDVPSPAERTAPACDRLRAGEARIDLPARLSVFGPTRLTTDQIQVLDALAAHREVHLWLPHPSDGLWARVRATAHAGQPAATAPTRLEDPTASLPRHPLLRSLARDARELQLRLATREPATDEHLAPGHGGTTLLAALQRDIAADREPGVDAAAARPPAAGPGGAQPPRDDSVQVHACHGRHRQVEVLREVLLGLLADDPSLELRDIIVMCPDIEAFAPLLGGLFSPAAPDAVAPDLHPGHQLTVRLADRSPRQVNPLLDVAARLLELAGARLTVSEVLDVAALPPVRRRFGFDDDALDRVGTWARETGVRFGLDAASRRGLEHVPQNTWRTGWDRVLLGVAMDEEGPRVWAGTLPLDDVDSSDVALAGTFAEYLDRLGDAVATLGAEQPLTAWVDTLDGAVQSLASVPEGDAWQRSHLHRTLTDALTTAGSHAGTILRSSDVRVLLAAALAPRPSRSNFRTGNLTICTMVPMRSVPHRVVVLLGMDDGVFPRTTHIDGDDVLALRPRIGERDARSEDRQLFLDAILAARDRLVVLHTGADERTGAIRPPAVPLGELLDVLERTRPGARDHVVIRHPLQPFDTRNFTPAAQPFSFDSAALAGSRALTAPRTPRPPFLDAPLPAEPLADLDLEDLIRFLEHPTSWFLRHRLQLPTREEEDDPVETLPVTLDPLESWTVGNGILRACLAGTPLEVAVAAERVRGPVPPGTLGRIELEPIADTVQALLARSAPLRGGTSGHLDVDVTLPGVTLTGTVAGLHGRRLVRVGYSKLSPKHRLRAWVQLLALAAAHPGESWTAHTVGRGEKEGVAVAGLSPVAPETARAVLTTLVDILRRGRCQPLPLAPRTSCAYAAARTTADPAGALRAATTAWTSRSAVDEDTGECADLAHRTVWGEGRVDALLAAAADATLPSPDVARVLRNARPPIPAPRDEPHLFGQLARLVWDPLLLHETVVAR